MAKKSVKDTFRCKYCDDKGEKSIKREDTGSYIKLKQYYAHVDCHINHLVTKGKPKRTLEDAQKETMAILKPQLDVQGELSAKHNLALQLMDYYKRELTQWQYTKLDQVNKGTYKKTAMKEGIAFSDLKEMWSNQKFLRKLEKIAFQNNIKPQFRFDYDLAIIIKEYDRYKKAKLKKSVDENSVDDLLANKQKMDEALAKKRVVVEEEVDIFDML